MFQQLGVIGCGLMGGSFALALKRAGLVRRVIGYSKSPSTTEQARRLGVIDTAAESALLAVSGSDIVLIAVPVAATEATFKAIRHLVEPGSLLMDVVPGLYDGNPAWPTPDLLWKMADETGAHRFGASPTYQAILEPLAAGYPTVSICSCTEEKQPGNYHWPNDISDNVDFGTVTEAIDLSEAMVRRLAKDWL